MLENYIFPAKMEWKHILHFSKILHFFLHFWAKCNLPFFREMLHFSSNLPFFGRNRVYIFSTNVAKFLRACIKSIIFAQNVCFFRRKGLKKQQNRPKSTVFRTFWAIFGWFGPFYTTWAAHPGAKQTIWAEMWAIRAV